MYFMKTAIGTALAALSLTAASVPALAGSPGNVQYSYVNGLESLTINNTSSFDLTNVLLTETLLNHPDVTDSTQIGTITAGTSQASDTGFLFPLAFGDNPDALYPNEPYNLTVTASGTPPSGVDPQYFASFNEYYNPDGTPSSTSAVVPLGTNVPEPGSFVLLSIGLSVAGLGFVRRARRS